MNPCRSAESIIHLPLVLVLNRAWQAIHVRSRRSRRAADQGRRLSIRNPHRLADWLPFVEA